MEHHTIAQPVTQRGFTLIEILIGLAIFTMILGSVYSGYNAVIDIASKSRFTSAALSIMESRVEMVRNMRYEDVGTVGGVPAGTLPQTETVELDELSYELTITIRNVDNPFDGTVYGSPSLDLSPADYKLVQFDVTCVIGCASSELISMTTIVAQKQLENTDKNGNMLISVIDAFGEPIPQATLRVVNPNANPPIDLTTTTDNEGQLLLLSVATGSAAYEIIATKTGYSTDRTYPPNNPANALKPHATVASQQLTQITMAIDEFSTLNIDAADAFCAPVGPMAFRLTSGKIIGQSPDVPKYDATNTVSAGGSLTLDELEWDTYQISPTDPTYDIAGTSNVLLFTVNPDEEFSYDWTLAPKSSASVLVSVVASPSANINGAAITITGTSLSTVRYAGFWPVSDTDWSTGNFSDASANLETTVEGMLTLEPIGGPYATGSAETLTSETLDLGSSQTALHRLEWTAGTQPPGTDIRLQLAANNDNSTWQFVGPDGASTSYFESPGNIDVAALNNNRYLRYRIYLETIDETESPSLDDVTVFFSSPCVLPGQAYLNNLPVGQLYTVTVDAAGYQQASASFTSTTAGAALFFTLTP